MTAGLLDLGHHGFAANAGNGRLAGGIDVENDNAIGCGESRTEIREQVAGAGVAMRLKDNMNTIEAALPRGSQRGANLGGMGAIVGDHAHPGGASAKLEGAINPAEALQAFAYARRIDVQPDPNRHGRRGVKYVVGSRDLQVKIPQRLLPVLDREVRIVLVTDAVDS